MTVRAEEFALLQLHEQLPPFEFPKEPRNIESLLLGLPVVKLQNFWMVLTAVDTPTA